MTELPDELSERLRRYAVRQDADAPPVTMVDVLGRAAPGPVLWRRPAPWLIAAAVVALAVAGSLLVASNEDDPKVTVVDSPDPTPTSVPTSPTTPTTPTATTEPQSPPQDTPIVVAKGLVLGWWDGAAWLRSDGGQDPPVGAGASFQLVRLDEPITTSIGSAPAETAEEFCSAVSLDLEPPPPRPDGEVGPDAVAVAGVAEPRPRPVEIVDGDASTYRDAARTVLSGLGIDDDDPDVLQVVRADVDGDGTDEVFVVLERLTNPDVPLFANPGDYSVVFVREVVGGEVRTTVVHEQVVPPSSSAEPGTSFLEAARISAIADLNGDGRMELVLDRAYYEGDSTTVFDRQADGTWADVLSAGCGV